MNFNIASRAQPQQPNRPDAKPVVRTLQTFPMFYSYRAALHASISGLPPQVLARSPSSQDPFLLLPYNMGMRPNFSAGSPESPTLPPSLIPLSKIGSAPHDAPPYPSAIYRLPREDGSLITTYGSLALLNLWISLTGLAHAHLLTCSEASPILGEAFSPHVLLCAIAAFILAGALNLLAGGWVGVQAWLAARAWVAAHGEGGFVGAGRTGDADGGGSPALAIFAAAVAGTLILAGVVNLTAANRVRRAGIGRKGRYAVIGMEEKC
ncbi:uncharacterized protein SCHCODRAFT_02541145 [Schizophyllum commune H4-8]|nr:uncharacterized protein SCHCODRAFT_02541145 [Schizophyllum commune H4-8]KAI5891936.1 hypothetical protein SCHCODRAFT_02541145 [Schizophyllum commune H4-8]